MEYLLVFLDEGISKKTGRQDMFMCLKLFFDFYTIYFSHMLAFLAKLASTDIFRANLELSLYFSKIVFF